MTEDTASQLLLETISVLESLNLTELLPAAAKAWYDQRKLDDEMEQERAKTEAEKFCAGYLKK